MPITPRALSTNLKDALYTFLSDPLLEGKIKFVYKDGIGVPTLGVGFALLSGTPGSNNWKLRGQTPALPLGTYEAELLEAGITLTPTQLTTLRNKLEQAGDVLNGQGGTNPFNLGSGTDILGWTLTEIQMKQLVFNAIPDYETRVKNWLGNDTVYASLQGSQEMFALVSLAYNGILGNNLRQNILSGNRAEAWYEIRYGTNGGASPNRGVAKRRYYESEMFGLYDNPGGVVSADEAKQAYRTLQLHRNEILRYEAKYGLLPDGARGTSYPSTDPRTGLELARTLGAAVINLLPEQQVKSLSDEFISARDALFADLVSNHPAGMAGLHASDFNPVNIHLDPGRDTTKQAIDTANHGAYLNSSINPLTGAQVATRDILIGEGGNDRLMGGKGDDLLIGGKGLDTYYWRTGDGNDRIIDEDRQGLIVINDGTPQDLYASGAFKETAPGSHIWKSSDGRITLTHNSPWKLVTEDGSEIQLGDFAEGDFGIHLVDSDPAITDTLTGTADANYLDSPSTAARSVRGDAGRDLIRGSPQADVLQGGDGDDWIIGNGGADHIEGGLGNDYISGIGANSLVEGGDGNDLLTAFSSDWILIDSPHALISADVFWKDISTVLFTPSNSVYADSNGEPDFGYGAFPANAAYSGASSLGGGWTYQFSVANGTWDVKYFHPQTAPNGIRPAAYYEHGMQRETLTGSVILQGGAGDDLLVGNAGADVLDGGIGQDNLFGMNGDDILDGGEEDDLLVGGDGQDVLIGGAGRDLLIGQADDDSLLGDGGNDELQGGNGSDYLDGGADADILFGQAGDDLLYGEDGDDVLNGAEGSDVLMGGIGSDMLFGDAKDTSLENQGDDYLDGGEGNDVLVGGGGSDMLQGGDGNDVMDGDGVEVDASNQADDYLEGNDGNDKLIGSGGSDVLDGGAGDDQLFGDVGGIDGQFHGNDFLDGGDGDDLLIGAGAGDTLIGGAGNDQLVGDSSDTPLAYQGDDFLDGGEGDDFLWGMAGSDTLAGGEGSDQLSGNEGDDVLDGGAAGDRLFGGAGNDILIGGSGGDLLVANEGSDVLAGGEGLDLYVYNMGDGVDTIVDTGVNTLRFGSGIGSGSLSLALGSLLVKVGNNGDAIHIENFNPDDVYAGAGIDRFEFADGTVLTYEQLLARGFDLDGGVGDDVIYGTNVADRIQGYGGNDIIIAKAGDDMVDGGDGDDSLAGDAGNDNLTGGAGIDTLDGGEGTDLLDGGLDADTMAGGEGDDVYRVENSADLVNEMVNEGTDTVKSSVSYGLTANVENLELVGDAALDGTGNTLDNIITGNDAANRLMGGAGADYMSGGLGDDYYVVDDQGDRISDAVDTVIKTTSVDGNGQVRTSTTIISGGNDTVESAVSYTLNEYLENLKLTGVDAISGSGNLLRNRIEGNEVGNVLYAYRLNGYVDGVSQSNYPYSGWLFDGVEERLIERGLLSLYRGESQWNGNSLTVQLRPEQGDTLIGNGGDDQLYGDLDNDILIGGEGDDLLYGFGGQDTLNGGAGNDIYVVDRGYSFVKNYRNGSISYQDNSEDLLIEMAGGGIDTVKSNSDFRLAEHFENLVLLNDTREFDQDAAVYGTGVWSNHHARIGIGNDQDNQIVGNDHGDSLEGLAGNDTLIGGTGTDRLDGGTGADFMSGGGGSDTYVVDQAGDQVLESGPGGYWYGGNDTVESGISYGLEANVENLILLGGDNLYGTGNELNNSIQGNAGNNLLSGQDGHDSLYGEGGNDTLDGGAGDDSLNGGAGDDVMSGGAGSDIFIVDSARDVTREEANAGHDLVYASVTHTLGSAIEDLYLTGHDKINGTGNELDNLIVGNDANNVLTGLGGDDRLDGAYGLDTLIGNQGNDSYVVDQTNDAVVEQAGEGIDAVESTATYTLSDQVENLSLMGDFRESRYVKALDGTGNALDNLINGNDGTNTLLGLDGKDVIDGRAGNDIIVGGSDDDTLSGGLDAIYRERCGNPWLDGGPMWRSEENLFPRGGYREFLASNSDTISGGDGNDSIDGGSGDDVLHGDDGDDVIYGGDDGLSASSDCNGGEEVVSFIYLKEGGFGGNIGAPSDFLSNNDHLEGGAGNDRLDGGSGDDFLAGGEGSDHLVGGNDGFLNTSNDDYLDGGTGIDVMEGGTGDDVYIVDGVCQLLDGDSGEENESEEDCDDDEDRSERDRGNEGLGNGYDAPPPGHEYNWNDGEGTSPGHPGSRNRDSGSHDDKGRETRLDGDHDDADGHDYDSSARDRRCDGEEERASDKGNHERQGRYGQYPGSDPHEQDVEEDEEDEGEICPDDQQYAARNGVCAVDTVIEKPDEGIDTVYSSVSYILTPNVENLILTGSGALNGAGNELDNQLTGNSGRNRLDGGAGNDLLDGGVGADRLFGGQGDDTYIVDNARDRVLEAWDEGVDTVRSSISYRLGSNIERLALTGNAEIDAWGNGLNNQLYGNAADNLLDGGAGADILAGGQGNDVYVVDDSGDLVIENPASGVDLVRTSLESYVLGAEIENLMLTSRRGATGQGNALDNHMLGGRGNDTLVGEVGNDTLDGGRGADRLIGGAGDDIYVVDNRRDSITEAAGEGMDTVQSHIDHALGDHLENLTLLGNDDLNGTGNALANVLTGNDSDNVLDGAAGADTLLGGDGDDVLGGAYDSADYASDGNYYAGGRGDDRLRGTGQGDQYQFELGDGEDRIQDRGDNRYMDVLNFGAGITKEQLWFRREGTDLVISVLGTEDAVTVDDWYRGAQYHVEQIRTANGEVLLDSQVESLRSAMAAFAPSVNGEMYKMSDMASALEPVLAANWQTG